MSGIKPFLANLGMLADSSSTYLPDYQRDLHFHWRAKLQCLHPADNHQTFRDKTMDDKLM